MFQKTGQAFDISELQLMFEKTGGGSATAQKTLKPIIYTVADNTVKLIGVGPYIVMFE